MRAEGKGPPWPHEDGLGGFDVDLTFPDADATQSDAVRREWQRQLGGPLPLPSLLLPRRSEGSYTLRHRLEHIADVTLMDICSDTALGRYQAPDRIEAVFQLEGTSRNSAGRRTFSVESGQVGVSAGAREWESEFSRGSRAFKLFLPAREVRFPKNQRLITASHQAPAARLLLAHLRSWAELHEDLSPAASWNARGAALELLHGLLNDQVVDDEQFSPALVRAAMERIEVRLLGDPDLSPRAIADSLHVSVRTLHRAFANEARSVMGYVRERRLERARAELLSSSLTVSEAAARWHYSDVSHFIRAYRKQFDELPGAPRKRHRDR